MYTKIQRVQKSHALEKKVGHIEISPTIAAGNCSIAAWSTPLSCCQSNPLFSILFESFFRFSLLSSLSWQSLASRILRMTILYLSYAFTILRYDLNLALFRVLRLNMPTPFQMLKMTIRLVLLSSILQVSLAQNLNGTTSQACYWPDGSLATGNYACGSDDTVNHACCPIDGSCVDGGYCFGLYGYLSRFSCTDRSWNDAACPSQCFNAGKSSWADLSPCDAASGQWCCLETSSSCCGNTTFNFAPGGITAWRDASRTQTFFQALSLAPATVTVTQIATSSLTIAATTLTSTFTPTVISGAQNATCQAAYCSSTTVGLAVGLPLGCALVAALAWLYIERRRSRGSNVVMESHGEPRSSSFWAGKPELEVPKLSQRQIERFRAAELD